MRVVNLAGRLGLITDAGVVDVETASGGRFSAEIQDVYARWQEFCAWAEEVPDGPGEPLEELRLGSPVPRPRQVFAVGLNYVDHAHEAGVDVSDDAMVVFTKFPSSITGPVSIVELPDGSVDFEAELVAVIGKEARKVAADDAWDYVAGLTVGQDLSERELQLRPPTPQFNLAKSYPGFSPLGPVLATVDEFADANDLEISCTLNGTQMQHSRTKLMIFPIAEIIARLSETLTLYPGDVIFTGTPAGIGFARDPKVLLGPGDELITRVESIGTLTTRFIAAPA